MEIISKKSDNTLLLRLNDPTGQFNNGELLRAKAEFSFSCNQSGRTAIKCQNYQIFETQTAYVRNGTTELQLSQQQCTTSSFSYEMFIQKLATSKLVEAKLLLFRDTSYAAHNLQQFYVHNYIIDFNKYYARSGLNTFQLAQSQNQISARLSQFEISRSYIMTMSLGNFNYHYVGSPTTSGFLVVQDVDLTRALFQNINIKVLDIDTNRLYVWDCEQLNSTLMPKPAAAYDIQPIEIKTEEKQFTVTFRDTLGQVSRYWGSLVSLRIEESSARFLFQKPVNISQTGRASALFTELDYKKESMNFSDAMHLIQTGNISLSLFVQHDIQEGTFPIGTNFIYTNDSYTGSPIRKFTADINFESIEITFSNIDSEISSDGSCSFQLGTILASSDQIINCPTTRCANIISTHSFTVFPENLVRNNPDNWKAFLQQASLGLQLNITYQNTYATHTSQIAFQFTQLPFVEIPAQLSEKVSAGALAGIIIGCLLGILFVIALIYIMIKVEESRYGVGYTLYRYRLGPNKATGVV